MPTRKTAKKKPTLTPRQKSLKAALKHLDAMLPGMTKAARQEAKDKMSTSTRPLITAKAVIRQEQAHRTVLSGPFKCPDLSAALEARTAIVRRMPAVLRSGSTPYEEDLVDLSIKAILQEITQEEFDVKCKQLAEKALPAWMSNYRAGDYTVDATRPIEAVPATALERALGAGGLKDAADSNAVIPNLPAVLKRESWNMPVPVRLL